LHLDEDEPFSQSIGAPHLEHLSGILLIN